MTLALNIRSLFHAVAWGAAGVAAALRQPRRRAKNSTAVAQTPVDATLEDAPEFYTLDVAFTPYGPEVLQFWIPAAVRTPDATFGNGDFQ